MKALTGVLSLVQLLKPVAITTTQTAQIDLADAGSDDIVISTGVKSDGTYTVTIQEGNAADYSDMADVAAGSLVGKPQSQTLASNSLYEFGYLGNKRYLQVTITEGGSPATGIVLEVLGIKGNLRHATGA